MHQELHLSNSILVFDFSSSWINVISNSGAFQHSLNEPDLILYSDDSIVITTIDRNPWFHFDPSDSAKIIETMGLKFFRNVTEGAY